MKEATIYIANDGTEWPDKNMCLDYEYSRKKANFINGKLGPYPKNNTAIKHTIDIHMLWKNFLLLCMLDNDYIVRNFANEVYEGKRHDSHLGHYLYRSNNPLYDLYARFNSIDFSTNIEYDQPYYATHPIEFKGQIITSTVTK